MNSKSCVIIDTSVWIEALRIRGDKKAKNLVADLLSNGQAAWCEVIALELWNGAKGKLEKETLAHFHRVLPMLPIDEKVWLKARSLALESRKQGMIIPAVDLIIAACAVYHGAGLVHNDKHMDFLLKL